MTKKKVQVRVKKRKLKLGRVLICLLVLGIIILSIYYSFKLPIKNIYVIGNNIIPEEEIIKESGISSYPSFLGTSKSTIIKKLKNNEYINNVNVKKKFWGKIYLYIQEKKVLSIYDNKLLLEDSSLQDNTYKIYRADKNNKKLKTYLFDTTDITNITYINDNIYYKNQNTLILYSKNTSKKLITEKEIEFNNDISFGIYEK